MTSGFGARGDPTKRPIPKMIDGLQKMLDFCDLAQQKKPELADELDGLRKDLQSAIEKLRRMQKS